MILLGCTKRRLSVGVHEPREGSKHEGRGRFKLLYWTQKQLAQLHSSGSICLLAIDEAHCVSEWGWDFRPEYRVLGALRDILKGVPCMALTGAANQLVKDDIIRQLRLGADKAKGLCSLQSTFNRPNLFYEVKRKIVSGISDAINLAPPMYAGWQSNFALLMMPGSTIVYCGTIKETEEVSRMLERDGIRSLVYHSQIAPSQREENHRRFMMGILNNFFFWRSDEVSVMVATIAFGMGIDKADVRQVIHHGIPKTIDAYYQHSGRAGRDGSPSRCLLFHDGKNPFRALKPKDSDLTMRHAVFDVPTNNASPEDLTSPQQQQQLAMRKYVLTSGCRRAHMLSCFGEGIHHF